MSAIRARVAGPCQVMYGNKKGALQTPLGRQNHALV
jgi:hypothetical protein